MSPRRSRGRGLLSSPTARAVKVRRVQCRTSRARGRSRRRWRTRLRCGMLSTEQAAVGRESPRWSRPADCSSGKRSTTSYARAENRRPTDSAGTGPPRSCADAAHFEMAASRPPRIRWLRRATDAARGSLRNAQPRSLLPLERSGCGCLGPPESQSPTRRPDPGTDRTHAASARRVSASDALDLRPGRPLLSERYSTPRPSPDSRPRLADLDLLRS